MIRRLTCPVCKKKLPLDAATTSSAYPFCSERCRHVDFFRWSDGKYAIVEPIDPDTMDPEQLDTNSPPQDDY